MSLDDRQGWSYPLSPLDEVRRKREEAAKEQRRQAELKQSIDATKASGQSVTEEMRRQSAENRATTQKVEVANKDLAKKSDIDAVIAQLKEVQLASLLGGQNKPTVVLADSTDLGERISALGDNILSVFKNIEADKSDVEVINALAKQYKELATAFTKAANQQSTDVVKALAGVTETLKSKDFSPTIKVASPKMEHPTVDMSPLKAHMQGMEEALKAFKVEVPALDLSSLDEAIGRVEGAIKNQTFPVPNYVLPFKDTNGKATQVQLDGSGNLPISATLSGADGAITDGASASIKATVKDLTNSNPLATQIMDSNGDAITSFGGGTQYSDGDANADPTGTVAMGTDGSNVFALHTDTSGDAQVDVLSSALPTGAATSAKQDTIIGHIDGLEGLLTTIDTDTGNMDTSLNNIEAGYAAEGAALGSGVLLQGDDGTDRKNVNVDATTGDVQVDVTNTVTVDGSGVTQPVSGTVTANLAAGTNNIGDVDILSIAAGDNNIGNVDIASIAAGDNNIGNVDIASALPAGTNAIGKLAANSGVDIGDVDVTSLPALAAGTNAIGKLLPPDVDVTTHTNYAKKYYTSTGAATDGIIWSPAAGKRWHVVALHIQVSAAATVTLEDDKAGGDEAIFKAEYAANGGEFLVFPEKYPLASGEDAADLIITTSAGNVYVTAVGYEI